MLKLSNLSPLCNIPQEKKTDILTTNALENDTSQNDNLILWKMTLQRIPF